MAINRIFYVTQDSLSVWSYGRGGSKLVNEFSDDDTGLRQFSAYLAANADSKSAILVDVIEEEFSPDVIPKLGFRDRLSLMHRRAERKFRRTQFRVSLLQGKASNNSDEQSVLHSAIVNHELLDRWLQVILSHCTPIAGIYSVPHIAQKIIKKLFPSSGNAMFVAPHQHNKLRQVFVSDCKLRSARLSLSPGISDPSYAEVVVTEANRSRRYLERTRLLSGFEVLEICVVADEKTAARIAELTSADDAMQYTFIDPASATAKLSCEALANPDCFEQAYVSLLARRQPSKSYAVSGENRYWYMRKLRSGIINGATIAAATCSILAAAMFSDAWLLNRRIVQTDGQVEQLAETFRRENERFDPVQADSYEMKLAVDSGDFILANRVPVPWVMNQISVVMGDYPTIQANELRWIAETPSVESERRQRPGEAPPPVPIPEVNAVSAVLSGKISPFDGDMRGAFALIDQFAAEMKARTNFTDAAVIEYPFDANTSSSVSGEIVGDQTSNEVSFRVRVSYALSPDSSGGQDEPS